MICSLARAEVGVLAHQVKRVSGSRATLPDKMPSLLQGSILATFFTGIKSIHDAHGRINDRTLGVSVLLAKYLNADYDGDECHISMMLDGKMAKAAYPLEQRFSVYEMSAPLTISGNVALSKPTVATMSAWMEVAE